MDQIRGEGELFNRLASSTIPVELLDAAGNVVGTFLPAVREPEPTAAELDAIMRNAKRRYTGDEVIAHLRGLK
jgi:hypothetical protein